MFLARASELKVVSIHHFQHSIALTPSGGGLHLVATHEIDALGRPSSQWLGDNDTPTSGFWSPTNPAGMVKIGEQQYDGGGVGDSLLTRASDALARHTTLAYDFRGRLTSTTLPDPDGAGPLTSPVESTTYDNLGRPLTQTDPLGNVTTYAYADSTRTVTTTLPDPDGGGSLTSPVLVTVFSPLSPSGRGAGGEGGLVASNTDPLGAVTTYEYDGAGRLKKVTAPDPDGPPDGLGGGLQTSPITQYQYDGLGNLRYTTDPLGHVTEHEYDRASRLIETTLPDPDGAGSLTSPVTTYAYTSAGHLASLTDPVGSVTTWVYDAIGRVTSETNDLSKTRTFEYDGAGNLTKRVDRLGRRIEYVYNDFDQVTSEKWYDGTTLVRTLSFAYSAAGEQVSASDPAATYSYSYDALSRVTSEGQTLAGLTPGLTFGSTLDAAGRRTKLLATLGSTSDFENTYTYDNLSRLTRLQQQDVSGGNVVADKRIDFAYDARSLLEKVSRYADQAASQHIASSHYTRDNLGRLTKLVHSTSTTPPGSGWGSSALAGYQYVYDAASRFTSIDSYLDGLTSYTHDNTDQLTGADHTGQTDETYTYDANGNRTMSGYSTTDNNQLSTDGVFNYTYDDEGNRLTKTKISNSEKEEYTWDHRNRLTKITFKNSSGTVVKTVDQTYDVFNRWIKRSIDPDGATGSAAAIDTIFSYENGQIVLDFDGPAAGDLTHRYLWNEQAVDQILASEDVTSLTSAGNVLSPLTDHLGTTRDIADRNESTGVTTITNHRRYDSYGILVSETNTGVDLLFGFTGRPFDESTGLQNNLNRWYAFGVWLNEDPIGFLAADSNLRRYVANSPLLLTDPTGLVWAGPPELPHIPLPIRHAIQNYIDFGQALPDEILQNPQYREYIKSLAERVRLNAQRSVQTLGDDCASTAAKQQAARNLARQANRLANLVKIGAIPLAAVFIWFSLEGTAHAAEISDLDRVPNDQVADFEFRIQTWSPTWWGLGEEACTNSDSFTITLRGDEARRLLAILRRMSGDGTSILVTPIIRR